MILPTEKTSQFIEELFTVIGFLLTLIKDVSLQLFFLYTNFFFSSVWSIKLSLFFLSFVLSFLSSYFSPLLSCHDCKTLENSNFLKIDKMVISVKIHNFSISRMTKQTSPLESSREI